MSETWNGLPDVAIKKIFGKLRVRDRARIKSVSKSWNRIANRVDIPTAREAPWLITSDDSFSKPEILLTQFTMGTINYLLQNGKGNYHFKLPKFYEDDDVPTRGCLCGTSNGWLAIAAGSMLKPDMFLWNPLSGTTWKLPPLSTVPFVDGATPKLDDLPSFIRRVQVFTQEECCSVAVVFSHPAGDKEDLLALCTPHEERWSIIKGDYCYSYSDILFHNEKLYALAKITNDGEEAHLKEEEGSEAHGKIEENAMKEENYTIYLSSRSKCCEVKVCVLRLKYKLNAPTGTKYNEDNESISHSFNITYANGFYEHLVECSFTGKLWIVTAIYDLYKHNSNGNGPVESFTCHKTSSFEVRVVEKSLPRITSIGEQTLFISSTGSLSIRSSTEPSGIISFWTDDARGLLGDQNQRNIIAREIGSYSMQQNVARQNVRYLKFPVQSKTGLFTPKLF